MGYSLYEVLTGFLERKTMTGGGGGGQTNFVYLKISPKSPPPPVNYTFCPEDGFPDVDWSAKGPRRHKDLSCIFVDPPNMPLNGTPPVVPVLFRRLCTSATNPANPSLFQPQ